MSGKKDEEKNALEGAAEQPGGEADEKKFSSRAESRLAEIEAIAERSEAEREGEFSGNEEPGDDEGAEEPGEQEGLGEADEKDEEKEAPPKPDEPEMITVKIDGEETQVPKSEVDEAGGIRAYQKEKAADKRLAEANRILQQAKQATGKKEQPSEEDAEPTHKQETRKPSKDVTDEEYEQLVEAIQYGDKSDAAQALRRLLELQRDGGTSSSGPEVIREEVGKALVQQNLAEIAASFQASPDEGGFSDISGNEELFAVANIRVKKALKAGAPNTWATYQKVGESIRKEFLEKPESKDEDEGQEDELAQRRKEKEKIDHPRAANQRAGNQPANVETTLEEERKTAFQDIKKSRGQPI